MRMFQTDKIKDLTVIESLDLWKKFMDSRSDTMSSYHPDFLTMQDRESIINKFYTSLYRKEKKNEDL